MVIEALQYARRSVDIKVVYVPILYPIANGEELVSSFRAEMAKHANVTMCILDHVSSMVRQDL